MPGCPNVIYLNFLGGIVTGTYWNNAALGPIFDTRPFNMDGKPGLSSSEQAAISSIWARIAEDYVPFNVDVTTERPAAFTTTVGTVLFTEGIDAHGVLLPAAQSGGVAFVNVFGLRDYL